MDGTIAPSTSRPTYHDAHRLFLQSMLTHRILFEDKAQEIYEKVCELTRSEMVDFAEFIAVINGEIAEVDMTLKRSRDERDGRPVIALINTKDDEVAQTATSYTASEITYLRQLLEMIVLSDDEQYAIGTMAALRLASKMKPPMSQREAQELLDRLEADRWLFRTTDGDYYAMDTRCVLELQTYLREQFGDVIKECKICYDVITMGERCELQDCPVRIHRHCADNFFVGGQNMVCPQCSTAWNRHSVFGAGLPV